MKNVFLLILISIFTTGCVKFEVNPGDVIGSTVNAGKEAYRNIKMNRNGEERRVFNHSTPYDPSIENALNIASCKTEILEIIKSTGYIVSETVTESSKIVEEGIETSVSCSVDVIVREVVE